MTTDISKWKRGMNVLVLCALVGFWVAPYFDSNLDAEIKAPLFAVVAATALCIRAMPKSVRRNGNVTASMLVDIAPDIVVGAGTLLASFFWLSSQDVHIVYLASAAILSVCAAVGLATGTVGNIAVEVEQDPR